MSICTYGWIVVDDEERETVMHYSDLSTILTLRSRETGGYTVRLPQFGSKFVLDGGPLDDPWPQAQEQAEQWAADLLRGR